MKGPHGADQTLIEEVAKKMNELKVPKMLTVRQCAELTGLSYESVQMLCREGKLVCIHVGNRTLINADKLIEWLNTGDGVNPNSDLQNSQRSG